MFQHLRCKIVIHRPPRACICDPQAHTHACICARTGNGDTLAGADLQHSIMQQQPVCLGAQREVHPL